MNVNKLDFDSINTICGNSKQVMVYGWSHCKYEKIADLLKTSPNSPMKKVFDSYLGLKSSAEERKTCEGTVIEQLKVPLNGMLRPCKAALTNLVLENYKRMKEAKPLIPLIFCYDIEGNRYPSNEETITSRDPKINKLVTHSELRRCYKLCKDVGDSTIEAVAQQTIIFVKVCKGTNGETTFQKIEPFWLKKDWDSVWKKRQSSKISTVKKRPWREQLIAKTLCMTNVL
jgi:hypothetical protein